jgi:hypothetical protein
MNKLAHEPVNMFKPFYHKDASGYHACGNLYLTGQTESYWDWNPHKTHKIVWLETAHAVQEVMSVPHSVSYKLYVHKHVIHHNNLTGAHDPWLQLVHDDQESWGHKLITQGAAWLVYSAQHSPGVHILSDHMIMLLDLSK